MLVGSVGAKVISLDWTVGWISNVNADGLLARDVIGVNSKWPIPPIIADLDDTLVVKLHNNLNVSTSLHFHGLFQRNTPYYDGALGATDCGIAPGTSFTYSVNLEQAGSFWVHSHFAGQYPDGFRTPLVVRDHNEKIKYDEDVIMSLSDWYHTPYDVLYAEFTKPKANLAGFEPIPTIPLLNDAPNPVFEFKPLKTYRLRFISMATFATFNVWIDGHNMTIVEVDGILVQPYTVTTLSIAAAQRYSVLVTGLNDTSLNYYLHYQFDEGMFALDQLGMPSLYTPNKTALISYGSSNQIYKTDLVPSLTLDDLTLEPIEKLPAIKVDSTLRLDVAFGYFTDYVNHGVFNSTIYTRPIVPALLTAMTTGKNATSDQVYGRYTSSSVFEYQKGIQIILVNKDQEGGHPFHMHGHVFQVLKRGPLVEIPVEEPPVRYTFDYSALDGLDNLSNPIRRDTVVVAPNSYAVLRFVTDNPGVWLFHCHIQWHVQAGLLAQFIEAPLELQQNIKIPSEISQQCLNQGYLVSGNAAGFPDLTTFTGIKKPPVLIGD